MTNKILPFNNTPSFKGSIYQLYFALQKCFEMEPGQKVFIETYGDVTLSGSEQFELKYHQGNLTDSDCNFWNTLKNWMHKDFDETKYSALILCTTQIYSDNTKFTEWNDAKTDKRFGILAEIINDSEKRAKQKQASKTNTVVSESLKLQRWTMEASRKAKLKSVIAKLVITCNAPSMIELYNKIKTTHCQPIPIANREDFWSALLGYLIHPDIVGQLRWEITCEAFEARIQQLTSTYCLKTKIFPQKYLSEEFTPEDSAIATCENHLFAKKIEEIEYKEIISEAIDNYIRASLTVLEEFRKYQVPPSRHKAYAKEVLKAFKPKYRHALRHVSDVIIDSQDLYDEVTGEESPDFQGFDNPSRTFRNGVLHMQMNDSEKAIKWRLEKDHE